MSLLSSLVELKTQENIMLAQANNILNAILNNQSELAKDMKTHMFDYKRINKMLKSQQNQTVQTNVNAPVQQNGVRG